MGSSRFLFGALLVMEAAWWYALLALAGAFIGLGASPLSGVGVLLLLLVAASVSLALQSPRLNFLMAQGVSMLIALLAIYVAIALGGGSSLGFHPWWLWQSISGSSLPEEIGRQAVGVILGIALWWRGMEIGAVSDVDYVIFRSFKIGLVVVTVAALLDALAPITLGMSWVAFAFFIAGLSALMVNQLQKEQSAGLERRWLQIAVGVLGAVVVTGLLLSMAAGGGPARAVAGLFGAVGSLLRGVVLLMAAPLALAMDYTVRGLQWVIARLVGDTPSENNAIQGALGMLQRIRDLAAGRHMPDFIATLIKVVEWAFVIYIVLVLLLLLYLAFVRRDSSKGGHVARASTRGQAGLWEDLASLLRRLLPQGKQQAAEALPPMPLGRDPRAVLLRLYYSTLAQLQQRGLVRRDIETPLEYERSTLSRVLVGGVSGRLTETFNGVRYGGREPPLDQVLRLEEEVQSGLGEVAEQGARR